MLLLLSKGVRFGSLFEVGCEQWTFLVPQSLDKVAPQLLVMTYLQKSNQDHHNELFQTEPVTNRSLQA